MPDPIHAVVVGGEVSTVVVIDAGTAEAWTADGTAEALWPDGELVDVTDADPQPGPGWTYDGKRFTAPEQPAPAVEQPAPAVEQPAPAPAADERPVPTKGRTP